MDELTENGIRKGVKAVYRRYTKEQKGEFIKQWLESGHNKRRFCEVNGLGYYSFIAWTTKPHKFSRRKGESATGFTELKVAPAASGGELFAKVRILKRVQHKLSDKVVLMLYKEVTAAYLRKIIRQ